MSRYDRREWQRPDPPHPERERKWAKAKRPKAWSIESRFVGDCSWFPRDKSWRRRSRYHSEKAAREGLTALRRPSLMASIYQYRLVNPQGDVVEECT